MKTFNQLEIGDFVYSASFLFNEYVYVMARKVNDIRKDDDGNITYIAFNGGQCIYTQLAKCNDEIHNTILANIHSTNIEDFMGIYRKALKDAKQTALNRRSIKTRIRAMKNLLRIEKDVKKSILNFKEFEIKKSILEWHHEDI